MTENIRLYATSNLSQVVTDEENRVLYRGVSGQGGILYSEPTSRLVAAAGNKDADFYQKGERVMIRTGDPGNCQMLAGGLSTVVEAHTLPKEGFDRLVRDYQETQRTYQQVVADTNAGWEGAISEARAILQGLEMQRSNAISDIPRPEFPDIVKMLVPGQ